MCAAVAAPDDFSHIGTNWNHTYLYSSSGYHKLHTEQFFICAKKCTCGDGDGGRIELRPAGVLAVQQELPLIPRDGFLWWVKRMPLVLPGLGQSVAYSRQQLSKRNYLNDPQRASSLIKSHVGLWVSLLLSMSIYFEDQTRACLWRAAVKCPRLRGCKM